MQKKRKTASGGILKTGYPAWSAGDAASRISNSLNATGGGRIAGTIKASSGMKNKKHRKPTSKTGKFEGKSNALGHGGRAAQLRARGVPGGVIGNLARAAQAAPGQKNFHGKKKMKKTKKKMTNMPAGKAFGTNLPVPKAMQNSKNPSWVKQKKMCKTHKKTMCKTCGK